MRRVSPFLSRLFLAVGLLGVAASGAPAVNPDEVLDDPKLEQRARELSAELRCMKCQNQSIDDSNADLARDLRVLVRERLVAGDSNEEVLDYLVNRYGEFVLLKPRFSLSNLALWLAPAVALIFGLAIAWSVMRSRSSNAQSETPGGRLSDAEHEQLTKILDEREGDNG